MALPIIVPVVPVVAAVVGSELTQYAAKRILCWVDPSYGAMSAARAVLYANWQKEKFEKIAAFRAERKAKKEALKASKMANKAKKEDKAAEAVPAAAEPVPA